MIPSFSTTTTTAANDGENNDDNFQFHVDNNDNQTIRLIQPNILQKSKTLLELIHLFLESMFVCSIMFYCLFQLIFSISFSPLNVENDDFKKIVSNFVQTLNNVGEMIEKEKIKVRMFGRQCRCLLGKIFVVVAGMMPKKTHKVK